MRVMVTGATGFLGLYIVERLLDRGETVRAFCRREIPELRRPGVEIVLGDIRRKEDVFHACLGVDAAIHTAALAGIRVDRRPYYETNVVGTQNLLAGLLAAGVPKLVYTGSPSAADSGTPQEGTDESAPYPTRFLAHYPETKAIAERAVLAANGTEFPVADSDGRRHSGRLATCSLRPRLIWGPRDRNLIPRLIDRAKRGKLPQIGDGTNRLDMIYVENAAAAHLLALDRLELGHPIAGNAYYLTQGEPVNCWQWIGRLLALLGLPPVKRKISFKTAWRLGLFYETAYRLLRIQTEPPMTRFLATQLAQSYWFDIGRARRDLGYSPTISTEEGLRRLVEQVKKDWEKPTVDSP